MIPEPFVSAIFPHYFRALSRMGRTAGISAWRLEQQVKSSKVRISKVHFARANRHPFTQEGPGTSRFGSMAHGGELTVDGGCHLRLSLHACIASKGFTVAWGLQKRMLAGVETKRRVSSLLPLRWLLSPCTRK